MRKIIDSLFGYLSPLHSLLTISLKGRYVGQDHLGNQYYTGKPRAGSKLERRWVSYARDQEASQVPPEWHGWLHHQSDIFPDAETPSFRRDWQLPHQENMTGTTLAYRPQGHVSKGGIRAKASGDYQAWSPDEAL